MAVGSIPGYNLTNLPSSGFQPLTGVKFPNLASAVIQVLFVATGVLFVIFVLIGGVQWVSSGGDKEGLDSARKKIKNALIGLTIVLGIYAFGGILNAVFGVDLFSVCFPGPDTPAAFKCPPSGIGGGGRDGGSPATDCGGGLNLGQSGCLGKILYQCMPYGSGCNTNPAMQWPQNCPIGTCP